MNNYRSHGFLLSALFLWGVFALPCRADLSDADCIIEPHMRVEISTSVEGVVENITVDRGDVVEKDQILVTLESGVEKASVELARLRAREDAEILLGQARVEFEERSKGRIGELSSSNLVSQHTKDEADYEASRAKLELRQARENRKRAEQELMRAIEVLNRLTIRSPIDGIVIERVASPGESISEEEEILKLAQIDPLNVELIVPASEFGHLRKGMRLAVRLGQPVNAVYDAEVVIVDPVIDAASGTFGVRALLPNPDLRLPAGLSCTAEITGGEDKQAQAGLEGAAPDGAGIP
ncbi:MAG: efflux RND transporter periplasmic adaptor subunit [Gammaproteobacteria bacterium]|jgi:RND family efflux transporter MFP subunit